MPVSNSWAPSEVSRNQNSQVGAVNTPSSLLEGGESVSTSPWKDVQNSPFPCMLKYEFVAFYSNCAVFVFQYENPWTIPNMLSMTRIGLAPVLGYLILEEDFNVALGVFALAGLTDLVSYEFVCFLLPSKSYIFYNSPGAQTQLSWKGVLSMSDLVLCVRTCL